jgi:hypothetical protein
VPLTGDRRRRQRSRSSPGEALARRSRSVSWWDAACAPVLGIAGEPAWTPVPRCRPPAPTPQHTVSDAGSGDRGRRHRHSDHRDRGGAGRRAAEASGARCREMVRRRAKPGCPPAAGLDLEPPDPTASSACQRAGGPSDVALGLAAFLVSLLLMAGRGRGRAGERGLAAMGRGLTWLRPRRWPRS